MSISAVKKYLLILVAAGTAFLYGCDSLLDDGRVDEGVIEYQVTYPKLDPSSILAELLPTKMVMKFKDDHYITDLSAGFGMFRMNVINNAEDMEFAQMVKLINDRFVVKYNKENAGQFLKGFPDIEIVETGKKKTIANYECDEAIVTVFADTLETYTIYYTKDIRFDNSNWFTQYAGIDGVLLEYQVERYNLCSRFTANHVLAQEIDNDEFNVPEEYEVIDEEEMNQKMEEIFNNFSE